MDSNGHPFLDFSTVPIFFTSAFPHDFFVSGRGQWLLGVGVEIEGVGGLPLLLHTISITSTIFFSCNP